MGFSLDPAIYRYQQGLKSTIEFKAACDLHQQTVLANDDSRCPAGCPAGQFFQYLLFRPLVTGEYFELWNHGTGCSQCHIWPNTGLVCGIIDSGDPISLSLLIKSHRWYVFSEVSDNFKREFRKI